MSHIVTIQTEIRDQFAVAAACTRLDLPEPRNGSARLFSGEVEGLVVQLPEWRYPIVCHLETGKLEFDHYEGRWGNPQELDRLLQAYAVEKAKIEARKQSYTVCEYSLPNGDIKLSIETGGPSCL